MKLEGTPNESMLMTEFAEYYISHVKKVKCCFIKLLLKRELGTKLIYMNFINSTQLTNAVTW